MMLNKASTTGKKLLNQGKHDKTTSNIILTLALPLASPLQCRKPTSRSTLWLPR